jgi:AraC-like DNA-binding protein
MAVNDILKIRFDSIYNLPFTCSDNLRIIMILKGCINVEFISGSAKYKQHFIDIIGINEPIKMSSSDRDNFVMTIEVNKEFIKEFYPDIEYSIFNCNNLRLFYNSKDTSNYLNEFRRRITEILYIYMENGFECSLALETKVKENVLYAIEKFDNVRSSFNSNNGDDVYIDRFKRIDLYFMKNITDKITLKDIANQEYLNENYLSNEFTNRLNKSFSEILSYYRIRYSIKYLLNSQLSIDMICYECGYTTKKYYYKHFKRYIGCTPKEFQNENKQEVTAGINYNNVSVSDKELKYEIDSLISIYINKNKVSSVITAERIIENMNMVICKIMREKPSQIIIELGEPDRLTDIVEFVKIMKQQNIKIEIKM